MLEIQHTQLETCHCATSGRHLLRAHMTSSIAVEFVSTSFVCTRQRCCRSECELGFSTRPQSNSARQPEHIDCRRPIHRTPCLRVPLRTCTLSDSSERSSTDPCWRRCLNLRPRRHGHQNFKLQERLLTPSWATVWNQCHKQLGRVDRLRTASRRRPTWWCTCSRRSDRIPPSTSTVKPCRADSSRD